MKDILDQELAVGDDVITTPKNYRGLVKAKIVGFTPKKVRVVYMNTWNYGHPGRDEDFLTPPDTLVKFIP